MYSLTNVNFNKSTKAVTKQVTAAVKVAAAAVAAPVKAKAQKQQALVIRGGDHEFGDELKALVLKQLRDNLCEIVFIKVDGTKRVMYGTLIPTFFPELSDTVSAATQHRKENNPYLITVWDYEVMGWRSFDLARFNRLTVLA